jgi:hypothetical protein
MDSGFRRDDGQKLIKLYAKFTKARKENRGDKALDSGPVLAVVTLLWRMTDGPSCLFLTFSDIVYASKFLN